METKFRNNCLIIYFIKLHLIYYLKREWRFYLCDRGIKISQKIGGD